jgi:hypothetical protein
LAETVGDSVKAKGAYEAAIKHNPFSLVALKKLREIYTKLEDHYAAVSFWIFYLYFDFADFSWWKCCSGC